MLAREHKANIGVESEPVTTSILFGGLVHDLVITPELDPELLPQFDPAFQAFVDTVRGV